MNTERRDRLALWGLGGTLIAAILFYTVADLLGWVPDRFSARVAGWRRANPAVPTPEYVDPTLFLGIEIGDTRFRLNYVTHHAIVTRPRRGVKEWIIPAHVTYQGETFEVVAFDSFALLNAPDVERVSVPHTLTIWNQAQEIMDHPMDISQRKE